MAEFKILRIRFRWTGNWTPGYSYIKDDVVRYGGKTYVALKTHTSASNFYTDLTAVDTQIPPQPDPQWELMLDGYEWTADWQTDTFYQVGDIAKKNGIVYICTDSHTSTSNEEDFTDDLDAPYWIVYTATDNWRYNWATETSYSVNDIVKYNGVIYRCLTAHISASTVTLGLENDQLKWALISDTHFWRGEWTISTRYRKNDIVRYNGMVYRCNTGHTSAVTATLGLEYDLGFWTLFYQNIEYKGTWNPTSFRYKLNDIVKYGAGTWLCITPHVSSSNFDESKWEVYLPGFEFDNEWNDTTVYQKGDVVSYGGYDYFAKTNNVNQKPSIESDDWELLKTSYKIRGEWDSVTEYKVGDVVRRGGMLYVAIADSISQETTLTNYWELLIPGERWIGKWENAEEYLIGDVVTYISNSYRCLTKHTSSQLNRPDLDTGNVYWTLLVEGNRINVLLEPGDIKTFGIGEDGSTTSAKRKAIGVEGQALKAVDSEVSWSSLGQITKIYYVSLDGDDNNLGDNLNSPWRTIKHACDNAIGPATIFVKTGAYQEILPISIGENVALVGDELRGTTVEPVPGFEINDMFYVRNGSGIRNMTLRGLTGTLGTPNVNGTRRPTAGAYVSLDPGTGPSDSDVWITTRSPYIQNVTTFGEGCTGLKIDGSLHDGGNRSIVCNDFTQILSDGIGIWCTNLGLTEAVSVFSYYGHIGYLAENGGKIRGTNGNSSYGTYGCVAEGFDPNEIPITGTVNNRYYQAQIGSVVTHPGEIYAVEYTNAGTNYTNATFSFSGAGFGAAAVGDEIRDGAIYQSRIYTPGDSSAAGGGSYITVTNNAQGGDNATITIAASDQNTASNYVGMRIFITSGTGAGQYGYIYFYDDISKTAGVLRESDDQIGWDHVIPGKAIEPILDTTTTYRIEPRVTYSFPGFSANQSFHGQNYSWNRIAWGDDTFVAIATVQGKTLKSSTGTGWSLGADLPNLGSPVFSSLAAGKIGTTTYFVSLGFTTSTVAYSIDAGTSWNTASLPSTKNWFSVAFGEERFVGISFGEDSTTISTNGTTWIAGGNLPASLNWIEIAYGNGVWVAIATGPTNQAAYSTDGGATWTATTMPASVNWSSVTYGNGRFVAIAQGSASSAYSFDGITWIASTMPSSSPWRRVRYGQGVFLAIQYPGNAVAYSNDGYQWTVTGDDSALFLLPDNVAWESLQFGNPNNVGRWVTVTSGVRFNTIVTGARAIGRATVTAGRISRISMIEPGSGYSSATASISVFDPNRTSDVIVRLRVGNGALGQPTFSNRGTGYITPTTTVSVNGDGYAEDYQLGQNLIVSNLSLLPGPGANLTIEEINDVTYKVITITYLSGTPGNYTASLRVSPTLDVEESPDHGRAITVREKYSQVRLTGHDFLDIGAGNFQNANYPSIPILQLAPENEVLEKEGGRVFYTSTDQDGNFRVGELFKVEQATGTVTVSADLFSLSGLTELSLGGVSVGGTGVVIREFSTDATFTADSNNIIPTQRAIRAYLNARISGGGANALTTIVTAGIVRVGPQSFSTTTNEQINVPVKVRFTGGLDGDMLQWQIFASSFSNNLE